MKPSVQKKAEGEKIIPEYKIANRLIDADTTILYCGNCGFRSRLKHFYNQTAYESILDKCPKCESYEIYIANYDQT